MKKDIPFLPVEGVKVAITRDMNESNEAEWRVFLINKNDFPITNVFVTSRGYGNSDRLGETPQQTSTLRHFYKEVAANGHQAIELIDPAVFHLTNEYWVSYFIDTQIYDKRFVFVPGSLDEQHLISITPLQREGVLHD